LEPSGLAEDEVLLEVEGCADPTFRGAEAGTRAQEVGSQVALLASLLAVDTEVVERLYAPAENELQNVVKLFQRKVVRSGGTSGLTFNNTTRRSGDHNKMGWA
jgi:hypothetical protein